jgi:ketosteroid isomerase-like protein
MPANIKLDNEAGLGILERQPLYQDAGGSTQDAADNPAVLSDDHYLFHEEDCTMKALIAAVAALCVFAFLAAPLTAQQWTDEQKEVWEAVEAYSKLAMEGNVDGFLEVFHPDFVGWHYGSPVPDDYAARVKMMKFFLPLGKVLFYHLTPLAIRVHGDVAVVHYVYSDLSRMGEGEPEWKQGRWTDILMKKDDTWLLIADHGGPDDEDDDDD